MSWERHLEIEYVDSYTEYGCNIHYSLVVVRGNKAFQNHPRHGAFGSMCYADVSEASEKLVEEKHPEYKRVLSAPDFVARISDSSWHDCAPESVINNDTDVVNSETVPEILDKAIDHFETLIKLAEEAGVK